MERLANIFHLGIKELRSLQHDLALVLLILWAFSLGVYSSATSMPESLHNAAIAVVDEDQSQLSERLVQAFQAPYFRTPERIDRARWTVAWTPGATPSPSTSRRTSSATCWPGAARQSSSTSMPPR